MKILHYVGDRSGVFLYRAYYPSIAIADNTEHNVLYSRTCSMTNPISLAYINWADIIVFHRQYYEYHVNVVKYLQSLGKKVVFEIDDDWLHLNHDNPFKKKVDTKPEILEGLKKVSKEADYITVTNKRLAKIMKRFNKNVEIIPNYISDYFLDYNLNPQQKEDNRVNLLWSGAQNHHDNVKSLAEPLKIIFEKYDNIALWIVGHNYSEFFPFIDKRKMRWIPWMGLENYSSALTYGDIGLAPMVENKFNASKSNIRILEYSYMGIPCVASDIYSYAETIEHEKNGYLAKTTEDWVKYLSMLIEDRKLREKMGAKARKLAIKNMIENNYQKYIDFYERLMAS